MKTQGPEDFERSTVIAGVVVMLLGIWLFAANDAMGKWLVGAITVGQVLFLRSISAFIVLTPMLVRQNRQDLLYPQHPWLQLARVVCATGDTGLFYAAVKFLPLADVMTFYMAGPIYVAAISHFFLGEKLGWRRWLAIFVGFVGVLIALRPSSAMMSLPSIFALLGSFCFALVIIFNRVLRTTSDATLVTWQTIGALLIGGLLIAVSYLTFLPEPFGGFFAALAPYGQWNNPDGLQWAGLILLGVVSCLGHILIARSLKMAPASVLAPLQYTLLLWAIIFGMIFFNNYPDRQILVGAAIIIVAGLFIFHRKKVVTNKIPKTDVSRIGR